MSEDEKLLKDAKKLPWEDRLSHKNWKVRNDANIDLAAVCDGIMDPKDPRLKEFGPLFKKAVSDSNAPVQEKALDALVAFLRAADADASRFAKEICDAIVAKCLTGRPKTVEKAQSAFLLWVELEACEVFLEAMEKAIKNKVAKAVVPAIDVMFQAVSDFGTKVVAPKKILKMLPELFDHQDQNVRASAKGLTIELCRWIGKEPVKSILFEKMRDTMKKEIEGEMSAVTGIPKPTRKIRSEQIKESEEDVTAEASGPAVACDEAAATGPSEIDEYDLVDPVDILVPLEKSGFWEGVKATKWSDRRDAVAELTKLASVKKISPGDFSEVCRTLKKLITDVNIAVGVEAVQAIGNLAKGLRKDFSNPSRLLLPVLLEKLKEKKPVMVEALTQTLQAIHASGCVQLVDIVEDVKLATKNKVPSVRSLTLLWITTCIESSPKAAVLKLHKDYIPILMESLNDGTPEVRDAAFSALAGIAKMVGMRPLERSLEKLDEVRKKKLTEMIGSGGSGPIVTGATPAVMTRSSAAGNSSMTSEVVDGGGVRKSAASMLTGKKPPQPVQSGKKTGTSKKTEGGSSQGKNSNSNAPEEVEPAEMSLEEIEEKVAEIVQADVIANLKSTVWKERLEAMTSFKEMIETMENVDKRTEILVRLLSVLPGWAEKNVQVQQKVIEVVSDLADRSPSFSKRCVVLCIVGVTERASDIKTRVQALKCLTSFCEAVGPGFVFDRLFKIMKEHKNPKVLSEGILWMVTAVEDFGISHVKLKDVIDFAKDVGLQSSVAATRTAAIKLLGLLHKFVGPDLKAFVSDVKPALQSALDAEYEKNPFEGATLAPKRAIRAVDAGESSGAVGADGLPREDISPKLTPSLIKNLSSPDWKTRQESIEAINKIIEEANKRIQPTGTGEMFASLKGRLCDSNKNLVMMTLTTLGNLACAMGPSIDKSSKGILTEILKCLGDNKKLMRETVIKTLDAWMGVLQFEKLVPYVVPALIDAKICADGRKELIEWVTRQLGKCTDQAELVQMIKPMALSLQDKSSEVRKAAELCLMDLIKTCGPDQAGRAIKDLHGTALAMVQPMLDRQRSSDFVDSVNVNKGNLGKMGGTRHVKSTATGSGDRPASRSGGGIPRATAAKGNPVKISKQAAAVAAQDAAVQGQALFNLKDSNKEERERSISRKLKFEEPRLEQVQEIESDLVKYFREDLHWRMLSPDFRKQVDGLDMLQKAVPDHAKEMIELVDVLFKWSVLRFCESNTTCLLKVLDFLPDFVEAMKNEGYTLTEYEANILLPCLVEKSGHNIEKVREKMRELTKLICFIYPTSKLFVYILEGLKSKNNRTRIESVDHVGYMIDRYGIEIAGPSKALQLIAVLTSERDGELRKSALQTLSVAYKILGDDIWRHVGKLSDAQRSMLDDKFKWKAREMEKRKEGKPGEERAALRRSVRENGLDAVEQSGEAVSRPSSAAMTIQSSGRPNGIYDGGFEPAFLNSSLISATAGPSDWNEALDIIESGATPEHAVEGMKLVCHELNQAAGDTESPLIDDIAKDADRLVFSLTKKVASTFHLGLGGASSRSCKYVLNTLMQTFQLKKLAHNVKQETLNKLIMELLLWLLDERVPLMDDGSQLLKALNVLMLKILENADRTSAFVVLIQLLRPIDYSRFPGPTSEESTMIRSQKFSDLVVKCLIKLTKVLNATIYEVDLDRLLQSIHEYLQDLGMEEIRRRAGADDKPLRMVKTVLHELVKLRGTAIKGHLSMVPIDIDPQPIILAYIDLNLQTLAAARMLTPSGTAGQAHWSDSSQNGGSSPAHHSNEAQLKQELASVFKKIGDKQTCTIGLYELYRITQLYPQVDIFSQLQNASEAFRTYIRDGLAQMERNAAAGRTPGSLPMVTPPPVSSPLHTSPKQAPLSPLNTRLQSMRLDTPVGQESDEYTNGPGLSGDLKKDNYLRSITGPYEGAGNVGGDGKMNFGAPMPGTLDAIRERMKNIQAATAGKPPTGGQGQYTNGWTVGAARNAISRIDEPSSESVSHLTEEHHPAEDKALSGLQARMEKLKSGGVFGSFV
ncbi:hypothetical protein GOP47_0001374 [Adiantum capillus-veneris]|uniref:Protein MOR1 n=1 Tax=Adiantum capillus-veneris TaxID=13818 RepID=A0A9D4V846_ADICA|nr:hypothetical protein GOP47_0001374 [Adiantum capillus-veneris]